MAGPALLERVARGDHLCWMVDDDRARLDATAAYLDTGLRLGQRVVYCGDAPERTLAAVAERGVAVGEALRTGRLATGTTDGTYLTGGVFDAAGTIARWRATVEQARADGCTGLRAMGEMSWARCRLPGAERVPWYEAHINELFTDGYVTGVCVYDRRLFEPVHLRRLARAHPGTAATPVPYDPDQALRIRRTHQAVRLTGEADLSNRTALAAVLEQLFAGLAADGEVTIDVSGLRFADAAAARLFADAASGGPGRLRLVGCSRALNRLLAFHGAADEPRLTVEPRP